MAYPMLFLSVFLSMSVCWCSAVGAEYYVPVKVTASSYQQGYKPQNAVDGNVNTSWRALGSGQWIQLDLGKPVMVNTLYLTWHLGDTRTAGYKLESSIDGKTWEFLFFGGSQGTKWQEEEEFWPALARYIRLVGYGNTKNQWNSIVEIEVAMLLYPNAVWGIEDIVASGFQSPNSPDHAWDGDANTRWSALGDRQWIEFDIGEDKIVMGVSIWFYHPNPGKQRQSDFTILVKADGAKSWTLAYEGMSEPGRDIYEDFRFDEAFDARYVRIVGHGNTDNDWNSINEVMVLGIIDESEGSIASK